MKKEIREQFHSGAILGTQSYPAVLYNIANIVDNANVDTIQGKQVMDDVYKVLNESKTPIMDLKPFVSGGEEYAQYDMKLSDVIKRIKKEIIGNVDLNFLINVCKEEHFKNMMRDGNPSPESTIASIKNEFEKPSSEVEKNIKTNIYSGLESTLLGKLKKDLGYNENEPTTRAKDSLNESSAIINDVGGEFMRFSPIGVIAPVNGDNYALLKSPILNDAIYTVKPDGFDNFELCSDMKKMNLPDEVKNLQTALNICKYDPTTGAITTSQNWDFIISLNPNGEVEIKTNEMTEPTIMNKEDVQNLFIESIKEYQQHPDICEEYNSQTNEEFVKDADAFNTLVQNAGLIVRFDNLEMVQNMRNNYYAIYQKEYITDMPGKKPRIFAWSEDVKSPVFDSYIDMISKVGDKMGCKKLLESVFYPALQSEYQTINFKRNRLTKLYEAQKELNMNLDRINEMKSFTDKNSISMKKLMESEQNFNKRLDDNIAEIDLMLSDEFHYSEN